MQQLVTSLLCEGLGWMRKLDADGDLILLVSFGWELCFPYCSTTQGVDILHRGFTSGLQEHLGRNHTVCAAANGNSATVAMVQCHAMETNTMQLVTGLLCEGLGRLRKLERKRGLTYARAFSVLDWYVVYRFPITIAIEASQLA